MSRIFWIRSLCFAHFFQRFYAFNCKCTLIPDIFPRFAYKNMFVLRKGKALPLYLSIAGDLTLRDLLWDPYKETKHGPFLSISSNFQTQMYPANLMEKLEMWDTIFEMYPRNPMDTPHAFKLPFTARYK